MIPEKRKQALFFFLAIYVIFAGLIIYLFLFNSGLEIREEFNDENKTKEVYVANTSGRVINNIKVGFFDAGTEVRTTNIGTLNPGQKIALDFSGLNLGEVRVVAQAPFHLAYERKIILQKAGLFKANFEFPSNIAFGKSFGFSIEICNETEKEEQYSVEESHSQEFFSEAAQKNTLIIAPSECSELTYTLTAIHKGETTIYFNVNSSNSSEKFEQKATIE